LPADADQAPEPPPLSTFDRAFSRIVLAEGGAAFSDHPHDPGGPTKWGVSWRAVRLRDADRDGRFDFDLDFDGDVDADDIRLIERHHAEQLFAEDYWGPAGCERWPAPVAIAVADAAYNQGPRTAVALLQRAIGAASGRPDGIPGPRTRAAVEALGAAGRVPELLTRFAALRADRYRLHPRVDTFFRGWIARLIELDRALAGGPQ
jgi:lysozyme family protein